jgi:Tfp pilus assembly protein PilO
MAIYGFVWYQPRLDAITAVEKRVLELQDDRRKLEITAKQPDEFARQSELLEARLEVLRKIIPPADDLEGAVALIQAMAARSGVQLVQAAPSPVVVKQVYREVPIQVEARGSTPDLLSFLDRVTRVVRLVNPGELELEVPQDGRSRLTMTATAFALPDARGQ